MELIRIYEFPDCKMVSSGTGMVGEESFDRFTKWFMSLPPSIFPKYFLFLDKKEGGELWGFHWLYVYDESIKVPEGYKIIEFKGGLYGVATESEERDSSEITKAMEAFLETHGMEIDSSRSELVSNITSPLVEEVLGYKQIDYYTPIKKRIKEVESKRRNKKVKKE
jgi:hypothetical protein